MKLLPEFKGEIGRLPYLAGSLALFFSQHLLTLAILAANGRHVPPVWWFWLNPLRVIAFGGDAPPWGPLAALSAVLLIDLLLLTLALRRARQAAFTLSFAPLVLVPGLQAAIILILAVFPPSRLPAHDEEALSGSKVRVAMLGLGFGALACVVAVAVSTLVFRTYGYALFVASPFVIGFTTAIIAARAGYTYRQVYGLVFTALFFGSLALVGLALEGIVCVVLAAPLIGGAGMIGAGVGLVVHGVGRLGRRATTMSVAIVPLMMAAEVALPPRASFDNVESIEVAASPTQVWDSVVHMGPIPGAPAAPFRWGLAYPMRGVIRGEGVGAIREGVFSTGVAYEKVTAWEPGRRLDFDVLSDPPTMRELSPYAHVNAPHTEGYFRTVYAHFAITPLADGRTRLTLATRHELDLEPALYWLPISQWATHANKVRVLRHFRDQAQRSAHPA